MANAVRVDRTTPVADRHQEMADGRNGKKALSTHFLSSGSNRYARGQFGDFSVKRTIILANIIPFGTGDMTLRQAAGQPMSSHMITLPEPHATAPRAPR